MCLIIEPNDLSFGLEVSRQAKHKKLQLLQGLNYSFIKKIWQLQCPMYKVKC